MARYFSIATIGLSMVLFVGAAGPADEHSRFYAQRNLVSDGAVPADFQDLALVNSWGLVASSTSPWWVADNGTGLSTLYDGTGAKRSLTVTVPGAPTGIVFNGGTGFEVRSGGAHAAARFLFASEDGTISGWNPGVPPSPPPAQSTQAVVAVDNAATGAVYKGLAIASTSSGQFLYATNFHAGTIDVFDAGFNQVPRGFSDPTIPHGYAPFGIQNIKDVIVVTYALQDADQHDDVQGEGHGYVNAFDTSGNLLGRIASKGTLNSPWGLALAPSNFGAFSGDLLVGNFGDGRIQAYSPDKRNGQGEFLHRGLLHSGEGQPVEIDGLWALQFGNGAAAGSKDELFFTAGPFAEQHGLFGKLVAVAPPGH